MRVHIRPATLVLSVALFAASPRVSGDFSDLESALRSEMEAKKIRGAAMAVVRGDSVVFTAGLGDSDPRNLHPVTAGTFFRVGSTTKMFVATAALLLAHEGRLDLDRPVSDYVAGLAPKVGRLTTNQLLTHTAGLFDDAPMAGPGDDGALGREVRSWTDENVFLPPGRFLSYSNPGYWLVGHVIETVAREPFADAMERLVLRPLGMAHSTFRPEAAARLPVAAPFDGRRREISPAPNHAGTFPSGSLYSNVREMARLPIALMNGGRLEGLQVLPEEVVAALLTPRVDIPERPGSRYGYGLIFETRRGVRQAFHTGGRAGYGSIVRMAPDQKVAVIVFANRTSAVMGRTANAALGAVEAPGPASTAPSSKPFREGAADFEGTFECRKPLKLELYRLGVLQVKHGFMRAPLRRRQDGLYTDSVLVLAATRGPGGRVDYLHTELHTLARVE
ncbi:MAG TPA: serine hydrolase domain-containing protein [Thermoanaerobaculia bacterium]|nr:serine hydrolase domain-containing protein [Thermoanaerobaculia bacterium]